MHPEPESARTKSLLGTGGMGEVYRASDPRLGRYVAIKVLPEAKRASPDRGARFEREARLLASINHPSIAIIHGLETDFHPLSPLSHRERARFVSCARVG